MKIIECVLKLWDIIVNLLLSLDNDIDDTIIYWTDDFSM